MEWYELEVSVPPDAANAVSERLFEMGAGAVTEELNRRNNQVTLKAYFLAKFQEQATLHALQKFFSQLTPHFPSMAQAKMATHWVEDKNWAERYKEFFKPGPISKTFYLKPVWEKDCPIPEGMVPILMEPGQAFGTGLHPSTRLAIRSLEQVLDLYPAREKLRLIDVGTGTGIIAIAAEKLGLKKIQAIDIDKVSVGVAKENLRLNQCSQVTVSSQLLSKLSKPFDLMVANILLDTHCTLAKTYRKLLMPGGILILSGLLGGQRDQVFELMRAQKMQPLFDYSLQEWAAFAFVYRQH